MSKLDDSVKENVPKDNVFEVLSNPRRRYILEILDEDPDITVRELAEKTVSLEKDKPEEKISSKERKSMYVSLYQNHLQKMDRLNAIKYNKKTNKVEDVNPEFLSIHKKIEQKL